MCRNIEHNLVCYHNITTDTVQIWVFSKVYIRFDGDKKFHKYMILQILRYHDTSIGAVFGVKY